MGATESHRRWIPIVILALLGGCGAKSPLEVDGVVGPVTHAPRDAGLRDGPVIPPTSALDLLFMVDNSNAMIEEQASLAAELPRFVAMVTTGDLDGDGRPDLRPFETVQMGVITPDMGTGGFRVPTCRNPDFGDDGRLRTRGRTDLGCVEAYPTFLSFGPGADPLAFATDVACVATVGTDGCGFEQPLEAVLKALSPRAPTSWTAAGYVPPAFFRGTSGHADGANLGFVRDDSVLAIVLLTDEADCSASDPDLFNPVSATYGTTDLNLRCFAHGEALHPVARFVDGLLPLRRHPSRLVFVSIAGVPVDLVPAAGEPIDWELLVSDDPARRDDRMGERVDPSTGNRLLPSCAVPGRGIAFPPVRTLQVARELEARGARVSVQSICQASFGIAVETILRSAN